MTKMTKRDWYGRLAKIVEDSNASDKGEALAFIAHQVELLDNRSSNTKPTKNQQANVGISESIKVALGNAGRAVTVTELLTDSTLSGFTNQKISSLLRQMVEKGEVIRTEEKKKAYCSLAE